MSSSEDVSSYIAKIENLSARIQDARGTITDDQKVAKIINSLPSSMRYFIPAWESQAPITQTLENLSARLLIEECRNQQADSSQGTAFYQQTKPRIKEDNIKKTDSGKISELEKKTECHYCHKIGHWSRECRKRIADQQKKNEKRKNQAGDYDHKGFNADTILKWNDCDIWWADSGTSCNVTFRREWFKSFTPIHNDHRIYLGDNTSVLAEGTGDIEILAMVNGEWITTSIRNVLYSSKLKKNLFSLGVCTEKGYRVDIDKDELRIYSRKDLKAVGQRQDGLYKMMFRVTSSSQGFFAKINNLQLWHERLAHISLTTIREMAMKGLINGLQPEDIKEDDFFCQGCQEGKAHRKPSHLSETKEYNPGQTHWTAIKNVFRYLKATPQLGILYASHQELTGYSDSDYARDIDSRKSTTGYIFMLNHGAVSWSSQKQSTVALSTTESEYIAACAATKEMVWLRRLLKDIGIKMDRPTVLNMDNQAAIKLVQNPEFHKRTKHIDVRYHYIRTKQEDDVLLPTLRVTLKGNRTEKTARAIIDTGSQRSYILHSTAMEMEYEQSRREFFRHSLFGGSSTDIVEHEVYTIHLSDINNSYRCEFEALGQPLICGSIPPVCPRSFLEGSEELDVSDLMRDRIEVLIGADIAGRLLTDDQRRISSGLVAIRTKLGWTVMGKIPPTEMQLESDAEVEKKTQSLQAEMEEHFAHTTTRDIEGRYEVALPWVQDKERIPSNKDLAENQLSSVRRKLEEVGDMNEYGQIFEEWMKQGIIEYAREDKLDGVHYLPHRPVYKRNSHTSRIRPVFNASARKRDHFLVSLLIRWNHETHGHAGLQTLLGILRENYWILRSRKTVKKIINQCIRCKRFTATPATVESTSLPEDRVRDAAVFEIVGVDLTGHLILKNKKKAWIVIFTCAVYRGVHLELVTSLSMEAFLQAFRRFIARRGRPLIVYSDNGTNFKGMANALKKIDFSRLKCDPTLKNITWKFIPPGAPWWGGWWERLIGMMKQLLFRILGQTSLGYEELSTVKCDVESLMNTRPLTYLTEESEDLAPLTPSLFLHEVREVGVPDLDLIDNQTLSRKYQYIKRVREDLRERFRIEYFGFLRQETRRLKTTIPFKTINLWTDHHTYVAVVMEAECSVKYETSQPRRNTRVPLQGYGGAVSVLVLESAAKASASMLGTASNYRQSQTFTKVCLDHGAMINESCTPIPHSMRSDVDLHAASPVAQNKQGRVQDLGRGFCPISIIQSPQTSHFATSKQLSILQCNINGLCSTATKIKLEEIMEIAEKQKIQIIALQETKLNEKYNLKYKNYNILRKDRNKEGGGLAFLIKNLYYEDIAINIPNTSDLEAQGIKVYLNQNKTINIFNMYHPPNNKLIDDGTMAQFLTNNTIIVGDLNAKHQLWGCSTPNPRGKILSNLFDDNAFMCLNDGNPTHHSYSYNTAQALDISFSSPDIFHKCKWQILKSIGSDHLPILIEISTKTKTSSIKEKFWNFKKANWNLYQQNTNEDFRKAPTRIKDLEQNWISFKNTIIKAAKVSIPRGNIKKWIPNYTHQAKDIQTLITKRNELQKKCTQTKQIVELN
ncbi:hypothetical protein LAZ67_18001468 [Cordylochernes scorpioides]|uniref:Uncharacterized protein n=1 Tax=Cordylochernes scorpioides TaxID=51811 RepID=A0ABY6LH81_9ARAC|nr:hypothetical protein LAZ67_18001468 [Cordylochernes scorpioides]